jgi:hypothetical protein
MAVALDCPAFGLAESDAPQLQYGTEQQQQQQRKFEHCNAVREAQAAQAQTNSIISFLQMLVGGAMFAVVASPQILR